MTRFTDEKTAVDPHAEYEPPRTIRMDFRSNTDGCTDGSDPRPYCNNGSDGY